MCEHGDTIQTRVLIPAHGSHTGKARWDTKPVDRCIQPIVAALIAEGVFTSGACCGHGEGDGEIILTDGRTLVIKPPKDTP